MWGDAELQRQLNAEFLGRGADERRPSDQRAVAGR
jgi:hypothetical protein